MSFRGRAGEHPNGAGNKRRTITSLSGLLWKLLAARASGIWITKLADAHRESRNAYCAKPLAKKGDPFFVRFFIFVFVWPCINTVIQLSMLRSLEMKTLLFHVPINMNFKFLLCITNKSDFIAYFITSANQHPGPQSFCNITQRNQLTNKNPPKRLDRHEDNTMSRMKLLSAPKFLYYVPVHQMKHLYGNDR